MDSLPILSLTAFAPLIGAIVIFAFRGIRREQARVVALAATVAGRGVFTLKSYVLPLEKETATPVRLAVPVFRSVNVSDTLPPAATVPKFAVAALSVRFVPAGCSITISGAGA